jgi:hypothetical protein
MRTFYIGLFNVLPTEGDNPGIEVSGAGYARIPLGKVEFGGKDIVVNAENLSFGFAAGDWGIVAGFGLFTDDGRLILAGPLSSAPLRVTAGDTVSFWARSISISAIFLVTPEELQALLLPKPVPREIPTIWDRLLEEE